ncbi:unnamed protein product [Somion occarium]|uniref:WD40 repeat-like protein n=1 Tax=Somion occarium TaxID=3059160 RepID=A0ABP1CIV3_9APHY
MSANEDVPWYSGPTDTQPFILAKLITSNDKQAPPLYTTSTFPWTTKSLETLWDRGLFDNPEWVEKWKSTVRQWSATIAAGSDGRLYIFPKLASSKPAIVMIMDAERKVNVDRKVHCCAWALNKDAPTDPLLIVAASSLIFILDARTKKLIGRIRGHGSDITSIAVHPYHPYIFCTTSKDQTTRIYDLSLPARQKPNNIHWPPSEAPSLAGPAFGLQLSEREGDGCGCCVGVLVGGRSGGHEAAVLGAAFHPTYPLVATCGMDRAVKIWRIPPLEADSFAREDKPIFSSELIHRARALSIAWLSQDVLMSHSAPAWMRKVGDGEEPYEYFQEHGTIVVWRWLGFDRFFPPDKPFQKVVRGVASDYRGSDSFKIISCYSLPMNVLKLRVYRSLAHDPIIVIPMGNTVRILNVMHFKGREPPAFPTNDEMVELTKRMRLSVPEGDGDNENGNRIPQPDARPPRPLLETVKGWELPLSQTDGPIDIQNCEVACQGRVIVGVGIKGTMVVWKLRPSQGE